MKCRNQFCKHFCQLVTETAPPSTTDQDDDTVEILDSAEDDTDQIPTRSSSPIAGSSTSSTSDVSGKGKGVGKSSKGKKGDKSGVDSDIDAIEKVCTLV